MVDDLLLGESRQTFPWFLTLAFLGLKCLKSWFSDINSWATKDYYFIKQIHAPQLVAVLGHKSGR